MSGDQEQGRRPPARSSGLKMYFPITRGSCSSARWATSRRWTASPSPSSAGRPWAWWASRAAARRTTGRAILRLYRAHRGRGVLRGRRTSPRLKAEDLRTLRRKMQIIFQDPYASLNPRMTVGDIIGEPLVIHKLATGQGASASGSRELLEMVGLQPRLRQPLPPRVLAAASASGSASPGPWPSTPSSSSATSPSPPWTCPSRPRSSTCWRTCRSEFGLTYLFIAHDLAVVRHISRPGRGDVPGQDGGAGRPATSCTRTPSTPTPRRSSPPCPCPTPRWRGSGSASSSRATCPAREPAQRAAASTPGAPRRPGELLRGRARVPGDAPGPLGLLPLLGRHPQGVVLAFSCPGARALLAR